MTKEEAVRVLKLERASWSANPNLKVAQCLCDAYDMAIKALEQTRWIPVSERLPEKDGRYLAYIINQFDDKLRYIMTCEYLVGDFNGWCPDDECSSNNVVAWMPLPEEYKPESEEQS